MIAGAPKVYLFFLSGAKKGKIEASDARIIRIGRQPYCEVGLDPYQDIPASGEHAKIVCQDDGTFTLFDCNSSWGTFKNESRLTGPVAVTTGDVITLGLDDTGRQGPSLKFYLETDILRCHSCSGPVYKRHFKCPRCKKKACLRCIAFDKKVCKPCSSVAASNQGGYEVVGDSVEAKAPARVVISGKDAQRVRRAQAKQKGKTPPPPPPPAKKKNIRQTKVMGTGRRGGQQQQPPAADPGIVAEPIGPFCMVCCKFVTRPVFRCPSCNEECCQDHRKGRVCPPCAGLASSQLTSSSFKAGRGTEPELKIPDLSGIEAISEDQRVFPPPPQRRPTQSGFGSGQQRGLPPQRGVAQSGFGSSAQRQALPPQPGSARYQQGRPVSGSGFGSGVSSPVPAGTVRRSHNGGHESKIEARAPSAVPCERTGCTAPLDPRSFFICEGCRLRLCPSHRNASGRCNQCVSSAAAAPLPQFAPPPTAPRAIPNTMRHPRAPIDDPHECSTVQDEEGTFWNPQEMIETAEDLNSGAHVVNNPELGDVKFECPYCEGQLPPHARSCHHCHKQL